MGATWPITKTALTGGASPIWFAEGRAALSALMAALVLAAAGRLRVPGRRDLPTLLLLGLFQIGGFFAFSHAAIAWVPAGRAAVLSNTTTVWIVPLSLFLLHEPIPPRRWAAAALGLLGVLVLTGPWAIDWSSPRALAGHALLLGAALSWAVAMVGIRRWPPHLSMLELLPWAFAVAAAALLPLALPYDLSGWDGRAGAALLFLGLFASPLGTWCIMQSTVALPIVVASLGFLATPAVGLLLSALWLGEPLTADLLAGAALILGGVAVATWPGRTR